MNEPGFFARDGELEFLLREVTRCAEGTEPGGAVVVGPAGVGKTRLVQELSRRAEGDPVHVVGTRAAGLLPFGAVAHLAPGSTPREHDDIAGWYATVRAALGDTRRMMVVDDAHLLDPAGAALVLHLAVSGSVTVIATVRTGEPCPDPVTALWRDGLARRVDLQPFSTAESEKLLVDTLGGTVSPRAVERLAGICGGNALFLHEVVIAAQSFGALQHADGVWRWNGAIPHAPRLVDAVESRLVGLDDSERRALAMIALGEPIATDLVVGLVGTPPLERLELLGLVTVSPTSQCSCTHPLYGEVLVEGLGHFQRRRLAGELATVLEETGPDTAEARLVLTRRRLDAGLEVSADELTDAAVSAGDAFDFALAEELSRRALAEGGNAAASIVLARALNGQGDPEGADEVLIDAEDAVVNGTSTSLFERYVDTRFAILHLSLARRDETIAMLDRVGEITPDLDASDRWDRFDIVASYRARVLVQEGLLDQTLELADGVLARPDTPDLARLHALATRGEALAYQGRTTTARAVHGEMRALAATGAPQVAVAAVWAELQEVLCLSQEGRVDEAAAIVAPAEQMMRTSPDDESRGLVNVVLAAVRLRQGRPVSARASLLSALHIFQGFDLGGARVWANALLAQVEAMLGAPIAARRAADAFHAEQTRHGGVRSLVDFALADALVAVVEGHATRAPQIMLANADGCEGMPMVEIRALHLAAVLGADPDPLVARLERLASETECDFPVFCVEHVTALAAGDGAALEKVAERFADLGLTLRAAEIAAQASAAFRSQSVHSGATRCAARSRTLAARCEGASTPALVDLASPADAARLSRREREVALLAARGATNRRIAEELGVSIRTVESHLYKAFAKLGVDQRSRLGEVLGATPDP